MPEISLSAWLSIVGLPSVFSMLVYLVKLVSESNKERKEHEKTQDTNMHLLMKAYQEQMKDRLMQSYRYYHEVGYIEEAEFKVWESQYQAYHSLGNNGFMTERLNELETMPRHPKKGEE